MTISVRDVGEDVVVSFAGSLDTTGLTYKRAAAINAEMYPHAGFLFSSPGDGLADEYESALPVSFPYFGVGASEGNPPELSLSADTGAGAAFGLGSEYVYLPRGYVSKERFSGSSTYKGASIESLRIDPGIYTTALPNDIVVLIVSSHPSATDPGSVPGSDSDPGTGGESDPDPLPNAVDNGAFESTLSPWTFYTNGKGDASIVSPGFDGSASAALVVVSATGSNTQLFQNGLSLEPNTEYSLSFAAYSNSGRNVRVSLGKHSSPYTNYGLNRVVVDLTTGWKVHTLTFTTGNFSSSVSDGRLFFWFASDARSGDRYFIDEVTLSPKSL
ncbi:carbohydrate binding domain-containing protein [Pelagicoccus enzymogenes]|uniref:carbohydrate binding domain-containing protein n=1 Tax=Pelagicoccus enzymogenes TaxID=2773457 RepID=UPI00281126B8|nr:carbohydrate binding domain-containing protein [Pelagicoccus enzymogenes]